MLYFFIFVLYKTVLACVVFVLYADCKTNDLLYFPVRGTRSSILGYIFLARGTRSLIIVLYFPHVKRALVLLCCIPLRVERALDLLCYIFRAWNALWRYCVIFIPQV